MELARKGFWFVRKALEIAKRLVNTQEGTAIDLM